MAPHKPLNVCLMRSTLTRNPVCRSWGQHQLVRDWCKTRPNFHNDYEGASIMHFLYGGILSLDKCNTQSINQSINQSIRTLARGYRLSRGKRTSHHSCIRVLAKVPVVRVRDRLSCARRCKSWARLSCLCVLPACVVSIDLAALFAGLTLSAPV
jgi:hypothetical protein